jgi:hypothetical protein
MSKKSLEVDYLAPYLSQLKDYEPNEPLSSANVIEVKNRCLADLKQRLIDRANLIQKRFETVG